MRIKSRWTLLLIPEDNAGTKKFRTSTTTVLVLAGIFVALIVFSAFAGIRLYTLRTDLAHVAALKEKNREQARQLNMLTAKVASIDKEMITLRSYHRHLSEIAKLDFDAPEEIIGIGGGGAGLAGSPTSAAKNSEIITDKIVTRRLHAHLKQLRDDVDIETGVSRELLTQIERQRSLLAHTPSLWPSRGWVSSRFGWRNSPFTGRREFHKGVDLAARKGTPIVAPADGVVTQAYHNGAYGNFLVIHHGYGTVTRYGHLLKCEVEVGQQVSKGDRIACVGSTGRSTGPHLHYEVLVNGIHVNPQRYMLK